MVDPTRLSTWRSLFVVGLATTVAVAVAGHAVFGPGLAGITSQDGGVTTTSPTPSDEREAAGGVGTPTPERTASPRENRTRTPSTGESGTRRHRYALREGANETTVHVYDSGRPGPTVVVVGGQHGNELAGYRTADDVANWTVERGVLVVVPRANPRGVANGTRKVDGRDLNAQFPVGEPPTSAQARAVWGVLERHDADVVVDLHSSDGIYGVDGGVGQAVFPTVTGDAVEHAETAIARVNREHDLEGNRSFRRGNVMGRSGQSLTRKVAGDLNESAYVVETTKQNTTLRTRETWTKAMVWELLTLHGLVSGDEPSRRPAQSSKRTGGQPAAPSRPVETGHGAGVSPKARTASPDDGRTGGARHDP